MKNMQYLMKTVNVPFKFLHVVRNPYDNIATMLLRIKKMRVNMKPDLKVPNIFGQVKGLVEKRTNSCCLIKIHNTQLQNSTIRLY